MSSEPDGAALSPADLWTRLAATDLPKLWIPKRDSIFAVEAIPALGSGKLDLRRIKEMARQLVSTEME